MYPIVVLVYSAQVVVTVPIYLSMLLMFLMTCKFLSVVPRVIDYQLGELDVECLNLAKNQRKLPSMDGRGMIKKKLHEFIRFYSESIQ